MASFAFTLQVAGIDPNPADYERVLYEAGCHNALIAGDNGDMFLDFERDGLSYESVVRSAICNGETAGGKVLTVKIIEDDDRA